MRILERVLLLQEKRCEKCPALWSNVDYFTGEYDEGCFLHKDLWGYCSLALLPHRIIGILVPFANWMDGKTVASMEREVLSEEAVMDMVREAIEETIDGISPEKSFDFACLFMEKSV